MRAIRLQTEYLKNPVGIDMEHPRLFWNCEGGMRQSACRILAFLSVTLDNGDRKKKEGESVC